MPDSTASRDPATGTGSRCLRSAAWTASAIEASSRWRADESQSNHYYAKNNAVVSKWTQSVAPQIMQKPRDHRAARPRPPHDPRHKLRREKSVQQVRLVHVPERLGRRAADGRRGKQKREPGRGFPVQVAE